MREDFLKKFFIALFVLCLTIFSIINILYPKNNDISIKENRNLANFPEFTLNEFFTGDYFSKIDNWFSDSFIFRDKILVANSNLKSFLSLNKYFKTKDDIVYIPARRQDENFDNTKNVNNENVSKNTKKIISTNSQIKNEKENIEVENLNREDYSYDDGYAGQSEKVGGGYILYNDAVYSDSNFSLIEGLDFLEVLDKYKKKFNNVRTSLVIAPTSSILLYGNTNFGSNSFDQSSMINSLIKNSNYDINIVNPVKMILDHRDEYLYFKYDHHWTNRGAYYAYKKFCESINEFAPALSDMRETILNSAWEGSAYNYTNDMRLYGKTDEVIAYISTRSNVMTITMENGEEKTDYSGAIRKGFISYSAFISGDNPFVEINVPSNDSNKCALVIKDSFGCAFVPYLVNNYGNIYVVDPRHTKFNVYEKLKDKNIVDIIAVVALYDVSQKAFTENVENMIK